MRDIQNLSFNKESIRINSNLSMDKSPNQQNLSPKGLQQSLKQNLENGISSANKNKNILLKHELN